LALFLESSYFLENGESMTSRREFLAAAADEVAGAALHLDEATTDLPRSKK
jgi:hypothetical protein